MTFWDRWSRDEVVRQAHHAQKRQEEIDKYIKIIVVDIAKINEFQQQFLGLANQTSHAQAKAYTKNVVKALERSIPLCELARQKGFIKERPFASSILREARHLDLSSSNRITNNQRIEALKRPLLLAYHELQNAEALSQKTQHENMNKLAQTAASNQAKTLMRRVATPTSSTPTHSTPEFTRAQTIQERAFIQSDLRQLENHLKNLEASQRSLSHRLGRTTVRSELVELRRNAAVPFITFSNLLEVQVSRKEIVLTYNFSNTTIIMTKLNGSLAELQKIDSLVSIPNAESSYYKTIDGWYRLIKPTLQRYQTELRERERELSGQSTHTKNPRTLPSQTQSQAKAA